VLSFKRASKGKSLCKHAAVFISLQKELSLSTSMVKGSHKMEGQKRTSKPCLCCLMEKQDLLPFISDCGGSAEKVEDARRVGPRTQWRTGRCRGKELTICCCQMGRDHLLSCTSLM